ncbi:hypothetical protein LSAT2_032036 [Lamellibrachia satsuma]|nr:hypothetical protein LSAT2_032036 [Lamellibrachia satsuma]
MKYYKPKLTRRDVYLQFKALNLSKSGFLSLDEFYALYDIANLKWTAKRSTELWFVHFRSPLDTILKVLRRFVIWRWFDWFIYFIIFANFVWILGDTILISVAMSQVDIQHVDIIENEYQYIWVAVTFLAIYIVEIVLKILALGPHGYFTCGWNRFDFLVVLVSAVGLLLELADRTFYYLLVLRPLRLLRLFKLKRRLRDILGTIVMLFSRMVSIAIVILLLYYSFAIIGIELFSHYNLRDSCVNGTVEVYYRYTNGTDTGYYYLNSFENILISGVTLFELTVVNNWYIIMEGYACVSSPWSRLYFMIFYILTMIVMTVVVAFILEAFLFRIQYRDKMHGLDMEDDAMFKVEVPLVPDELFMCHSVATPLSNVHIQHQEHWDSTPTGQVDVSPVNIVMTWFCGERVRSKDDFNMKMYKDEVEDWIMEEADRHHRQAQELRRRQFHHSLDSPMTEHSRVT